MAPNKEFLECGKNAAGYLWKKMIDMLFPVLCINCGNEDEFLCQECLDKIEQLNEQVCPLCFKNKSKTGNVCEKCKSSQYDHRLDGLIAVSKYTNNSLLNRAIHTFKYEFIKDLATPLSKLMIDFFKDKMSDNFSDYVVTPVPLHKKRHDWRGFNQAGILAENFASANNLRFLDLLTRTRFHSPQMELEKEKRLSNVENAFKCAEKNCPENIIIIDDVATTLATLDSCAKALKSEGAKSVFGLVLARVY